MKSELPKVLFPVCGKPMLEYVLDALEDAGVDEIVVVVGYRSDLVKETIKPRASVKFAEQRELLGTGHAVASCREYLEEFDGPVFIVAGDNPMLQSSSVARLFEEYEKSDEDVSCILGTVYKDNPFGMGRILARSARLARQSSRRQRPERILYHRRAEDSPRRRQEDSCAARFKGRGISRRQHARRPRDRRSRA